MGGRVVVNQRKKVYVESTRSVKCSSPHLVFKDQITDVQREPCSLPLSDLSQRNIVPVVIACHGVQREKCANPQHMD